MTQARFQL